MSTRKPDTFDIARQAWKGVMQLKRIVNAEFKWHFFTEAAMANSINWQIRNLSGVPQGDTATSRDGISIKPLTLTLKLEMRNVIANTGTVYHRIIILRGKNEQGDGTTEYLPAFEDGAAGILDILRFKDQDRRFASKTLLDKMYRTEATNPTNDIASSFHTEVIKLDGHINFIGSGTAPENGGIYMLYVSNALDGTMITHAKMSFTDN